MAFRVCAIQKHAEAFACFDFAAVDLVCLFTDVDRYESRSTPCGRFAPELISPGGHDFDRAQRTTTADRQRERRRREEEKKHEETSNNNKTNFYFLLIINNKIAS